MEVGKVSLINGYSNLNRNQNINFKGRLLDDKFVREALESSRLSIEAQKGKSWFSRALSSIRDFFIGTHCHIYRDSEGRIVDPKLIKYDGGNPMIAHKKDGILYTIMSDSSGRVFDVERSVTKKGVIKKRAYVELEPNMDGVETKVYYRRAKNGDVIDFDVVKRDARSGKLLELVRESETEGVLASRIYDDAGNLKLYSEVGGGHLYKGDAGNVEGSLEIGNQYYTFHRTNLSLAERMKAEGKLKGLYNHILGLHTASDYIKVVKYLEEGETETICGAVKLPLNTTIEDLLRMRDNGELQKLNFKK